MGSEGVYLKEAKAIDQHFEYYCLGEKTKFDLRSSLVFSINCN